METPKDVKLSLEAKINEMEERIKKLEERKVQIERTKINILPKTTLSNNGSFEKNVFVGNNVCALIVGINFANNNTTGQGAPRFLNIQLSQKSADQKQVLNISYFDPHIYCNQNYHEVFIPWDSKKENVICINYDRNWSDTNPFIIIDLVGVLIY